MLRKGPGCSTWVLTSTRQWPPSSHDGIPVQETAWKWLTVIWYELLVMHVCMCFCSWHNHELSHSLPSNLSSLTSTLLYDRPDRVLRLTPRALLHYIYPNSNSLWSWTWAPSLLPLLPELSPPVLDLISPSFPFCTRLELSHSIPPANSSNAVILFTGCI